MIPKKYQLITLFNRLEDLYFKNRLIIECTEKDDGETAYAFEYVSCDVPVRVVVEKISNMDGTEEQENTYHFCIALSVNHNAPTLIYNPGKHVEKFLRIVEALCQIKTQEIKSISTL